MNVVVTDYGEVRVSDKTLKSYLELFGKKRMGRYTKKSTEEANDQLCKDVSGMTRLYWLNNLEFPKDFSI